MLSRRFISFYLLILALALFLRLFQLGRLPLSDDEARWALQAWELTRGENPLPGSQAASPVFTAGAFFLFGASNVAARLWPALTGVLLVLLPALLREHLGERAALILAFGLAVDPGLWALARVAGSPLPAVTFLALTVALWQKRRYALAGVCAGLALLSGPALWFGVLTLALAAPAAALLTTTKSPVPLSSQKGAPWRTAALCALASALLCGTAFGFLPRALGAVTAAMLHFLRGWWTSAGVQSWQTALALLADETLPLLFGLIAAIRGVAKKDHFASTLAFAALLAFLLIALYPGRQVGLLAWVTLPLWILASSEIDRQLNLEGVEKGIVFPLAAFIFLLLFLAWFMLAHTTLTWVEGNLFQQPAVQMAEGVLLFLLVSLALAAFNWNVETAQRGGMWGLLAALGLATFGLGVSAVGLRHPPATSLWQPSPTIAQADLLRLTIDQISNWREGHTGQLQVRIAEIDSPALQWLLRDYDVEVLSAVNVSDRPQVVLTPATSLAPQEAGYRGQDFLWRESPRWENASLLEWLRWWLFRTMPQESESIILWVHPDLTFTE